MQQYPWRHFMMRLRLRLRMRMRKILITKGHYLMLFLYDGIVWAAAGIKGGNTLSKGRHSSSVGGFD
eukprot:11755635-Ditylum_brightwellii.AAC.1